LIYRTLAEKRKGADAQYREFSFVKANYILPGKKFAQSIACQVRRGSVMHGLCPPFFKSAKED
jgi:hypothetical protein